MTLALSSATTFRAGRRPAPAIQKSPSDAPLPDRYAALGRELDALKTRVARDLGERDVTYVRRLNWFSRGMEALGRILLHISFEPITFTCGVLALWVHKQLQATEIGHTALHGAYDKLKGGEAFASKQFWWDTPIDEASWRHGHNVRHHGNTNVAGRDPDIDFGPVRLTHQTQHRFWHRFQLPLTLLLLFPAFGFMMNLHFSGVLDDYYAKHAPRPKGTPVTVPTRKERRKAYARALRKFGRYYAKDFLLFPLLAGPMFWKVLLGNWLAEVLRDVYSAATIYCGHVGHDVMSYPVGTKAQTRGQWYAMQIASANDFEVSRPISILCGGLDRQIEHHLFPTFPPERLREIAPEVKAICERHGLIYRTDTWPNTLKKALRHVSDLAKKGGVAGALASMEQAP